MDTPLGGAGGGGTPGRPGAGSAPNVGYWQLALYIVGNALTIAIGLLLWNLNSVSAKRRSLPAAAQHCNRRRCSCRC